ncbi:MAG: SCO family protein [Armatimonadetes bacterium]|nr:SCO family protein [Armatimonadota bacterium]
MCARAFVRHFCAAASLALFCSMASAQYYGNMNEAAQPGTGRVASTRARAGVRVDQNLKNYLPLDLVLTESDGTRVALREYFSDKPVLLQLIFYKCPGVCTAELNSLTNAMRSFGKYEVGKQYDVLTVSIMPTETEEMAKNKKMAYLDILNRPGAEDGWHFFVGDYETVKELADAIGFRYVYDETNDTIVHPACLVVLTPQAQITQYFLETEYAPKVLLNSLIEAKKGRIGVRQENPSFWSCIDLDPLTGRRSLNVLKAVKIGGALTLAALVISIVFMTIKYKVSSVSADGASGEGS